MVSNVQYAGVPFIRKRRIVCEVFHKRAFLLQFLNTQNIYKTPFQKLTGNITLTAYYLWAFVRFYGEAVPLFRV